MTTTPTDGRSDADLISAHLTGHPTAFEELFLRHRQRLWAVALRTTGDPEDAADALQEAMISAFRRAGSYRGDAAVTTWLHRIVVNACLDVHRRRKSRPVTTWIEDLHDMPVAGDAGADRELRVELDRALRELTFDQRAAIVLVDVEGYSVAEAGEILGCPTGTIKSRCARGRTRLADALAHLRNPGERPSVSRLGEGGDRR